MEDEIGEAQFEQAEIDIDEDLEVDKLESVAIPENDMLTDEN